MEETTIEFLLAQVENILSYEDAVREPAVLALMNLQEQFPIDTFRNCATIILSDDENMPPQAVTQAFIILKQLLDVKKRGQLLFELWSTMPEEIKEMLRMAAVRGLLFQDDEVTKMGSCVFGRLFNVDLAQMKAGEYLHALFTAADDNGEPMYTESHRSAALDAVLEMVSPDNRTYDQIHDEQFQEEIPIFVPDMLEFFQNLDYFSLDFSCRLLRALTELMNNLPNILIQTPFVPSLLGNLPNLWSKCPDCVIFELLYHLFFSIIINIYDLQNFHEFIDEDLIIEYGKRGLNCSQDSFVNKALVFWTELLAWEKKRLSQNLLNSDFSTAYKEKVKTEPTYLKFPDQAPFHQIGVKAANVIIDKIIEITHKIDEKDTSVEDISQPQNCMFACSVVNYLFYFDPITTLDKIKHFFDENCKSEIWMRNHACVILASSLCGKTTTNGVSGIRDFVVSTVEFILPFIETKDFDNLRIIESALYVLTQIEKKFEFCRDIEKMQSLVNSMNDQLSKDPIFPIRSLSLLNEIIKKSKSNNDEYRTKLYESIVGFTCNVVQIYPDDINIIRSSFLTQYILISSSTDSVFDKIVERLKIVLNELESFASEALDAQDDALYFTKIQTRLWVITSIFMKFHDRISSLLGSTTAHTLFYVMKSPGAEPMHEEILNSLLNVILSLTKESSDVKDEIISYIPFSLESRNPSLVATTINALSFIFQNFKEEVIDLFGDTMTMIFNLLDDSSFPADIKPKMIFALARIIKSIRENITEEDIAQLFERLYQYITMDFSLDSEDSIHFFNEMYASIYTCYASLLYTMKQEDSFINRALFKNLIIPLKKLASLPQIENETVWKLCKFLEQAIESFGRKGNIFLNYHCNFFVCVWGIVSDDTHLKAFAEGILKKLKNS